MSARDLDSHATLTAVLGPTNTGKTHRALSRMGAHRSGMIGLPLRLLAREVYDKLVASKGEGLVALVTGEEKRVPEGARYWVATVEAMPLSVPVDFLAVDEIQLAASRERGHVFTDRILHARGLRETLLLGSDTMATLLQEMVPTVVIESQPRLSTLRYAGASRLSALPKRTALVAFTAGDVYALADRVRRERGGAAVVLGALSPRTRNAQVALYQSGEVNYLVATDAIGMGLNMDIDHICFAGLSKFDGQQVRRLTPAELAQIAGRAGRFRRDGTFGTLSTGEAFEPDEVAAIESHRLPPVTQVVWRNSELDKSSLPELLRSLRRRPRAGIYKPLERADDSDAIEALARDPAVAALASSPARVALLWEVASVPDYQQTLEGSHLRLLTALYRQLLDGPLRPDWLHDQMNRLDRPEGEIDALTTRIAFVRTWTTITHRKGWVEDPAPFQERARQIEDRLSDALHQRLLWRFVDSRSVALIGALQGGGPVQGAVGADGSVQVAGQSVGALSGFTFSPAVEGRTEARLLQAAARAALVDDLRARLGRMLAAEDGAFSVDDRLQVLYEGGPVGLLTPGPDRLTPEVRLLGADLLDSAGRKAAQERLVAWARAWVREAGEALRGPATALLSPVARGLLYAVEQGLGLCPTPPGLAGLSPRDRAVLSRLDLRLGVAHVYRPVALGAEAVRQRAVLLAVSRDRRTLPACPEGLSTPAGEPEALAFLGYPVVGPVGLRVDALETLLARLRGLSRRGPFALPEDLFSFVDPAAQPEVLRALGYGPAGRGRWCSR